MVQSGVRRRRPGGRRFPPRRKVCAFCVDKVEQISYKDVSRIRRFISDWGKIEPRRKTGTCAPHQRALTRAIKRARYVALIPFTGSHTMMDISPLEGPRSERFRADRRDRAARAPQFGERPPVSSPPSETVEAGDGTGAPEATAVTNGAATSPEAEVAPESVVVVAEKSDEAGAGETEPQEPVAETSDSSHDEQAPTS
jgi:small subunit ribosomal protein S18